MKWINLEKFGAELKRVELSNGTKFPAIVITDVAKYHASGATPLSELKQEHNVTGFEKLGGSKGRNAAHPVLFLTNTFSQGQRGVFNIYDNLSKLLNISRNELVEKYVTESIPDAQIILKDGFIDPNFHKLIQNNAQEHYGRTIYVPKQKAPIVSLPQLEKELLQNQHGLFPKANVGRIPIATLDKFGYDSSIVSKGFLSTEDAHKAGFRLSDLDSITMEGDKAILPLSVNRDASINFISNVGSIPQLSYSNLEWKSNLHLIKDFEAVIATRELCRDILNTKSSQLSSPALMGGHLERLSLAFQKCYQLGNDLSTAKLMKYDNDKTFTFISKNADNEWRYIEKSFTNKEDFPLNETTFKKAVETLARNTLVISSALVLAAPQGAELQKSLDIVLKNQLPSFAKFVKMDAKSEAPTLNEDGKKIHKSTFDREVREIQPNLGENLFEKQVVSFLNAGETQTDLSEIVGSGRPLTSDEMDAQLNASSQPTPKPELSEHNDAALNFLDDDALAKDIMLNMETTNVKPAAPTIDQYLNLPQGLKGVTAENYDAINETFKAVQYLEIVALPKLNDALLDQQSKLKHVTDQVLNDIAYKTTNLLNNQVLDPSKLNDAKRVPQNLIDLQNDLSNGVNYFEDRIAVDQLKLNLLSYRLATKIGEAPEAIGNLSVINVTADGQAQLFNDAAELATAKQAIYAHQVLNLPQDQFGIPTLSKPNNVLDEAAKFVQDNYVNAEPQNFTMHPELPVETVQLDVQRSREVLNKQPISGEFKTVIDKNIALAVINNSPTLKPEFSQTTGDTVRLGSYLDGVLSAINVQLNQTAEATNISNFTDPKFKSIMDGISQSSDLLDPDTNLQVGAIAKLRLITDVATKSLNDLTNVNDIGSLTLGRTGLLTLRDLHEKVLSDIAHNTQDINRQTYGSFLFARQSANTQTKESSQVWGMYNKDHPQAFRVNAYERDAVPDGVSMLSAPSYSSAVNEAYKHFQFSALASSFGLQKSEVEAINKIAILSGQDKDKANDLLQTFVGQPEITIDNFNAFDSSRVAALKISAPEATDIYVKLSMLGNLMNVDTKTPISDLTNESSKDHVVSIQSLLQPNNNDLKLSIAHIFANDPISKLPNAAKQIVTDALENNPFSSNRDVKFTVFSAEQSNDVAFARFIPTSWMALDSNPSNKQFLISKPDSPNLSELSNQLTRVLEGDEGFAPTLLVDPKLSESAIPETIAKEQYANSDLSSNGADSLETALKVELLRNAVTALDPAVKSAITNESEQKFNIVAEFNNPESEFFPAVRIQPHTQAIGRGQTVINQVGSEYLSSIINLDADKLKQATPLLECYGDSAGVSLREPIAELNTQAQNISIDNSEIAVTPPVAEPMKQFIPTIKPDDVLSMKPSQIMQDINLDAAWKAPNFEETASPDVKTLDAAVLAHMVYHSLPKSIPENSEISIERNANVYVYAINETQRALLNANDLATTVKGLATANNKLNNYAPTHFADLKPEDKLFKELLNTITSINKSANDTNSLTDLVNKKIFENPNYSNLVNMVAHEFSDARNNNSPELNATISAQQSSEIIKTLEQGVQNIAPSTENSASNEWNYKLVNPKNEQNVLKVAVINEAFLQLYKNFGGTDSGLKANDLGKNITIKFGSPDKDATADIYIGNAVPKVSAVYSEIKKTFINNMLDSVINNEVKATGESLESVNSPSYQPTTQQLQMLSSLAQINANPVEADTTAEKLVAYSKTVLEKNKNELANADTTNPAVRYAAAQTTKLLDRQDKLLKQFGAKVEKLKDKPNVEMLDYIMLSDSVNKISNASINTSEKEINAFFSKVISNKEQLEQTVKHVKNTLDANSEIYGAANNVLNSNAVHQALESIVESMPPGMKANDDFLSNFKEGFSANFGEHSNVTHKDLELKEPSPEPTSLKVILEQALESSQDNKLLLTLAQFGGNINKELNDDVELRNRATNTLDSPKPM